VTLADPSGLQIDDHLATFTPLRTTHHQIDAGAQQYRMIEWPLRGGLCRRVAACIERWEALHELGHPLDRLTAQIGLVARCQGSDPSTELALLVAKPRQRLVDELARIRLTTPVEHQLDCLVGDLPAGACRGPFEVVGCEEVHLAVVHAGQGVLGDEQRGAIQPVGEVGERLVGLIAQIVDHRRVEHRRLGRPSQERQRALLCGIELRRFVHGVETNEGVSQPVCNTPARH